MRFLPAHLFRASMGAILAVVFEPDLLEVNDAMAVTILIPVSGQLMKVACVSPTARR
jgi:hypothetical protein